MRVDDVDEPVVAAAARTPFEAARRVFVLERVDTMNDEVANRLLKTLEEPASFVHLILLTDCARPGARDGGLALPARALRPAAGRADRRGARARGRRARARAGACGAAGARQRRARALPGLRRGRGAARRRRAARRARRSRASRERRASRGGRLLERAEERRAEAEEARGRARRERLELEPKGRERKALEREFEETAKRDGRRARTEVLDLGLELAALAFRDLVCLAEGADAAVLGTDRAAALAGARRGPRPAPPARGRRALRGRARSRSS